MLTTFFVTQTSDDGRGDLPGSLSWAIVQVNDDANDSGSDPDLIDFDIPTSDPGYDPATNIWTIGPNVGLPTITSPAIIDGMSQSGYIGTPVIEISGSNASNHSGQTPTNALILETGSDHSTIEGLEIDLFTGVGIGIASNYDTVASNRIADNDSDGIDVAAGTQNTIGGTASGAGNVISGNGGTGIYLFNSASDDQILGNKIGTDANGLEDDSNGGDGIHLDGVSGNTVGGTTAAAANVISGNAGDGIYLYQGASDNQILGNRIGTDANGLKAIPNAYDGIDLADAIDNTVGGTTAAAANVISGNTGSGIYFLSGSSGNLILGNKIGTDATGLKGLNNHIDGIDFSTSMDNTIGGTTVAAANVISGNTGYGIHLISSASDNRILGNKIGTDANGLNPIPNGSYGLDLEGSSGNTIGGTTAYAGNVISGNMGDGIHLVDGATGNLIVGNKIGIDADGLNPIPNGGDGMHVETVSSNTIGGTTAGAGNVISGNKGAGIYLLGNASGNLILGNLIGTDANGLDPVPNDNDGLDIDASSDNTIGGSPAGAGNLISGNVGNGIYLLSGASGNLIVGNKIGTDVNGLRPVPNGADGLDIAAATDNTIGGSTAGAGNVISGNRGVGIYLLRSESDNRILGNLIGTDANGLNPIPNGLDGLTLEGASGNTIGGTASGAGNVISGNDANGISLLSGASGNLIVGNKIGTNASGLDPLPNENDGLALEGASGNNTIGGTASGAGNVISGNDADGISLLSGASGNEILGNLIGTDASGLDPVPDGVDGLDLEGASGNTIGGTTAAAANVISGNTGSGISILGGSSGNLILGNKIGTEITGESAMGNAIGVRIDSSSNNTVGGTSSGVDNVISGNTSIDIEISNSSATANVVQGNLIGTDEQGTRELVQPDLTTGSPIGLLIGDSSANRIGGTTNAASNVIAGCAVAVEVTGFNATDNAIQGNRIGADSHGDVLTNSVGIGIYVNGAGDNTVGGGTSGAGNLIYGYEDYGVFLYGSQSTGNVVQGNRIGLATSDAQLVAGTRQLAGIAIEGASSNTIGGPTIASGNTVSGNADAGVYIFGYENSASSNSIEEDDFEDNVYGILLYNAPDNGQDLTLRHQNRFAKSLIADVREFMGSVPRATSNLVKGSKAGRKHVHRRADHEREAHVR
ncbi:MAG: beta strand repeat-containing protein [Isosphaeraceae bacterium]